MTQLNGGNKVKNKNNGTNQNSDLPARKSANNDIPYQDSFEQSIVLKQSPVWSRTIMITMMLVATFGIGWSYFAKIEQVVPATGQLKPEGTVKEVQAPINGVVKSVYIKDGQEVKEGDLLLTFESVATLAELSSLNKIRVALTKENDIYRRLMGASTEVNTELNFLSGNLPAESAFLLKSRASLVAENQLLRSQIRNTNPGINNGIDERQRLLAAQRELESRSQAAKLEVEKIRKQLAQIQVRLQDTRNGLEIQSKILDKLKILAEEGGISQLQYLNQQQQVQTLRAEIEQLIEEEKRLEFDIQRAQQQVTNTFAITDKTVLDQISANKQRIAEVDSQFMRIILENEQRLADIKSRISQAKLNIKYQEVRAPVSGVIFDLQARNPGFVANPTQKLLQIVPNDKYIADVFITNKDIGFVREGMKVDVRVDSFPFSQFGDIKGKVTKIGSDALPPDETHQFYRFPATVSLDKQNIVAQGRTIPLQSGMSITANIRVREERTVMDLFTEMFTRQVDSLKEVR
ncbi:MAG: HlyD family efflux transporter periplasmic adaptor subunit [Sphaerospermopsis sp. SIO1G1]|nr:HlyD family efflux transporter periplasmic adaptor subunit [Sphaerospermopsis sp. SIO1G1]